MATSPSTTRSETVTARWLAALRERWATLDRQALIATLVEEPGACLLYALKLGRLPLERQRRLRDDNTVAGMLAWIVVLAGGLAALIAAL